MGLIYLGSVDAASDATMATVTNQTTSLFRTALEALITAVLADDPTVAAAAAAAVETAVQTVGGERLSDLGGPVSSTATVKDLDLIPAKSGWFRALSTALNRPAGTGAFSVFHMAYSDTNAAQIAVSVSTGSTPSMSFRAKRSGVWDAWAQVTSAADLNARVAVLPAELDLLTGPQHRSPKEGNVDAFRIRDSAGMVSFEVRPDGTTFIANAAIANGAGGGGGGTPVSRVHMVVILGQSNAVGKGEPVLTMLDGVSSRIWQLPDGGASLVPATAPLSMPGGTATGLAPGHALARELAEKDPNCVVVIVPAAKGGSGLVTDPALGYGKWAVGYNGPNPHLHSNAVSATQTALVLIATQWGLTPSVTTHWAQGEADGADGITRAAYAAELDILITDWLGRFGGVFVISGMVPQVLGTGTRAQIELALQDTPRRIEKVAYVPGIDNGGGAGGPTDVIHFGMEAILALGIELYKAIRRAANNVAESHTYPPLEVVAKKWGSEVTVEFTPSSCRVTAYEVQSSTDGSTWNPVTMAEPIATRVPFTSASPVKVRVRAIGTETSNWTAPVPAIGG